MERIIPVIAPGDKIYWLEKEFSGWNDNGSDAEYSIIPVYVAGVHSTVEGIWVDVKLNLKEELCGTFRYDKVWNKEYFLTEQEAKDYQKKIGGVLLNG